MKIVIIGGTGLIGSKTVAILRQSGHEVVAASPKSGINSITGSIDLVANGFCVRQSIKARGWLDGESSTFSARR